MPPTFTGADPTRLPTGRTLVVNLFGTQFHRITRVWSSNIGGDRQFTILSDTHIEVTLPPVANPTIEFGSSGVHYLWLAWSAEGSEPAGQMNILAPFAWYELPPAPIERRAWLVWGTRQLPLHSPGDGYTCTQLDFGAPEVRDVMNNRPDFHGVDDRSSLYGSRVVTANIVAWPGGRRSMDEVAMLFRRFMAPGLRPELHFTTEDPFAGERVVVLRGADMSGPMGRPVKRELQLSWVAPDPQLWEAEWRELSSGTVSGTGANAGTVYIPVVGDFPLRPVVRLYGPASQSSTPGQYPMAVSLGAPAPYGGNFSFIPPGFTIPDGRWIEIDNEAHTITWDNGNRAEESISWPGARWMEAPGNAGRGQVRVVYSISAGTGGPNTRVVVRWRNGFL